MANASARNPASPRPQHVFDEMLAGAARWTRKRREVPTFRTASTTTLTIESRLSSQLFLTQFSKDIFVPNNKQLLFAQHGLEEIPPHLVPELFCGLHSWIDFPIQGFLRFT